MNVLMRAAVGFAAIGITIPAGAQPSSPKAVWNLAWEDNQCSLTSWTGSRSISLRALPGTEEEANLKLTGVPELAPRSYSGNVSVTLLPSGQTIDGQVFALPWELKRPEISVGKLGENFATAFAKADEIRFVGDRGNVSFSVKGSAKAVAALRDCGDIKLKEWGVDPKAYRALRRQPIPIGGGVIRADDYPPAAMHNNESGSVVAKMNIDATGKVTSCDVVVSSRSRSLDLTSCAILVQRAHFYPAIGPDGSNAPGVRFLQLNWQLQPH